MNGYMVTQRQPVCEAFVSIQHPPHCAQGDGSVFEVQIAVQRVLGAFLIRHVNFHAAIASVILALDSIRLHQPWGDSDERPLRVSRFVSLHIVSVFSLINSGLVGAASSVPM